MIMEPGDPALLDTVWYPLSTPHLLLWLMPREALHVWYGIATLCRATSFRISDMLQSHNLLTSCEASPSVWRASFLALAQIRRYLYVLQLWKVKHVVAGGWAIFEWQRQHQGNGQLAGDLDLFVHCDDATYFEIVALARNMFPQSLLAATDAYLPLMTEEGDAVVHRWAYVRNVLKEHGVDSQLAWQILHRLKLTDDPPDVACTDHIRSCVRVSALDNLSDRTLLEVPTDINIIRLRTSHGNFTRNVIRSFDLDPCRTALHVDESMNLVFYVDVWTRHCLETKQLDVRVDARRMKTTAVAQTALRMWKYHCRGFSL